MSIIAGIMHFDGAETDSGHIDAVLNMYASMLPEGTHHAWTDRSVALAHWSRSSSPESKGNRLPMAIRQNSLAITAEARLDNRDELFETLSVAHADRKDISDSTLILLAYQKWGEDCPEHLHGDFSFAIYDRKQEVLVCVQSAFPVQPLYYLQTGKCFAFGSLIRPLLSLAQVPKQFNEQSFVRSASRILIQSDVIRATRYETAFAGVFFLPPATILTVGRGGTTRRRTWWRPDPNREIHMANDQDYYDQVRELTIRSVHDRMRTDERVVCSLSGGLDSSTIACIAARKLRDRGEQLTALSSVLPPDYRGPEKDEREFIEIVKRAGNLDVKYLHPTATMLDHGDRRLDWGESLRLNCKAYVNVAICETARICGAGVVLDGCGGEMGPTNHAHGLLSSFARNGQWGLLGRELVAMSRLRRMNLLSVLMREVVAPQFPALKSVYHRLKNPGYKITLPLNNDLAERCGVSPQIITAIPSEFPLTQPKHFIAAFTELCQGVMQNQPSMAHGIRILFPFLDRRIIDGCLAVPARLYQVDGWSRNLIRKSMQGILVHQTFWGVGLQKADMHFTNGVVFSRHDIPKERSACPRTECITRWV